ncbi:MAG: winged helix-turn-helix domain-containing protein [Chloroflexota bacterium]
MTPPKQILVIDDEPAITNALSSLLRQAGYDVSRACNGEEGLAQLAMQPDLVILDVMLPDIHGHDVCREIRRMAPATPVLMLTALDDTENRVAGLDTGADAYFTKPYQPAELLAQVRALLRRGSLAAAAGEMPLICGPLTLWDVRHSVTLDDVEIDLTPKEYELLRVFMQRPGIVFGRETLLREVWGYEYAGDTRTVDVHIQRLRMKIEADPSKPSCLVTVRGFGYRLLPESKG